MTIWYHYKGSLLRHRLSERELGTAVICTQFGVIGLGALEMPGTTWASHTIKYQVIYIT